MRFQDRKVLLLPGSLNKRIALNTLLALFGDACIH
jgi:hypothetical protein